MAFALTAATSFVRPAAARPCRVARRSVSVSAVNAPWFPGKEAPAHLDSSAPGWYGFDPLGLAKEPEKLKWYTQAELQHARWAMLGVAGVLFPELLGGASPATTNFNWVEVQSREYWAPHNTLIAIALILFAFVETRRLQDYWKPGSTNQDPIFNNKLPSGNQPGYPGGIFDPLGFAKGDVKSLRQKEIKNGRLAMVAFLGFLAQYDVSGGKTPLQNLGDHLANPWGVNALTNGKSIPFLGGAELNIFGGTGPLVQ